MSVTKTLYHCKIINDLVIPENVTKISSFAVCNNYELTNITLADNVTKIELDHTKHPGNDFGLISSYVQHDCERLSKIRFERLSIKIAKDIPIASTVDEEGNKIAKAKYKVFDSTGKIVYSGTTDGNGIYTATNVVQGEYTIKQVIPPSGYEKNDEEKKFTIDKNILLVFTDNYERYKNTKNTEISS